MAVTSLILGTGLSDIYGKVRQLTSLQPPPCTRAPPARMAASTRRPPPTSPTHPHPCPHPTHALLPPPCSPASCSQFAVNPSDPENALIAYKQQQYNVGAIQVAFLAGLFYTCERAPLPARAARLACASRSSASRRAPRPRSPCRRLGLPSVESPPCARARAPPHTSTTHPHPPHPPPTQAWDCSAWALWCASCHTP